MFVVTIAAAWQGTIRATLSVAGAVAAGSEGACKSLKRMHIRNFILGKDGDYNVAEKVMRSVCKGGNDSSRPHHYSLDSLYTHTQYTHCAYCTHYTHIYSLHVRLPMIRSTAKGVARRCAL